jgi:hypothetical protein
MNQDNTAPQEPPEKSRFYPSRYNWYELDQVCDKCSLPMHMAGGQDVAFCPNCAADRENARRGRVLLSIVKARDLQERLHMVEPAA